MTAVVFAGPTLSGLTHLIPPGITIRPPAIAGDLLAAIQDGATRIGLIDGRFGDVRAVWHKEILFALAQGIPVLGAASLGALRAADCAAFGMEPVGGIAEDYLTGRRTADADVAVLHGPAELGFRPLTLALVDALDRLADLLTAGLLDQHEAATLTQAATALHFTRRTWTAMLKKSALPQNRLDALHSAMDAMGPSRKARDALLLLDRLPQATPPNPRPQAVLTAHFTALHAQIKAVTRA
jgi:hypothetical protein